MPKMPDGRLATQREAEDDVLGTLERYKPELARVLPKYVDADRIARICTTSIRLNEKLFRCTKSSLFSCIMQCATLNIEPDTLLQHAHLIPFKIKGTMTCTLIMGYRGMRELVERTGKVSHVEVRAVFEGDDFKYWYGLNPDLVHAPGQCKDPTKLTHAYTVIVFKTGFKKFDVMDRQEIDIIYNRSMARNDGPWQTDFVAMCKKTSLRRTLSAEPMSVALSTAIAIDDRVDANLEQKFETPWSEVEAAKQAAIKATATPIEEKPAPQTEEPPTPADPAPPLDDDPGPDPFDSPLNEDDPGEPGE